MFHNINQYNVEQIVKSNKNQPFKSLNNQFLKMISMIRSLQDQLLAEQYNYQLLSQQNEKYQQALNDIKRDRQLQGIRVQQLQGELNQQMAKNSDLEECQQSMRSIFYEIDQLQNTVSTRTQQCQAVKTQIQHLSTIIQEIQKENIETSQLHFALSQQIIKAIQQQDNISSNRIMPLILLKDQLQFHKQQLQTLQSQQNRLKRQRIYMINNQKQIIMKLQYECTLLQQRNSDSNKIDEFTKICQNQQKLQTIIQFMLIKEDQLYQELEQVRDQYRQIEQSYYNKEHQIRQKQEEELELHEKAMRDLNIAHDKLMNQMKHQQKMLQTKVEKYSSLIVEQEISWKVNINLSTLKRLREAEEKNKHLKLNMSGLEEIKVLLLEEKSLFHQA